MHDLHPLIKCVCGLLCFFPGQWLIFLVLHACTLLGCNWIGTVFRSSSDRRAFLTINFQK